MKEFLGLEWNNSVDGDCSTSMLQGLNAAGLHLARFCQLWQCKSEDRQLHLATMQQMRELRFGPPSQSISKDPINDELESVFTAVHRQRR